MTDVPRVRVTRVGDHRVTAVTLVGVPGTTAVTDFATLPEVIGGQRGDVVVSPSTLNNSRAERDIRSFTTVQAALSSGLAIVVPKGVTISTTATLTIPSNLQLVIDGRMQRTFNGGAMFSTTGTATGVRISGTGSVGAQSLTVGTGPIFTGTYNDSTIEGIAVDTYAAGAAWSVSGTRLRLDQVKVFNAAATSATTGIAILTGDQVVVGGCYIVAGGDGMQISATRATIADNQIPTVPLGAYGINLLAGSGIVVRDNVIASSASAAAALRAASIVVLPRFQDNDVSGIVGSPIQIELGCLAYVYDNRGVPTVVPVTAANYTVGALDDRRLIEVNSATSRTITFLLDAKNSLPIGEFLGVSNIGTANVQLAAEAGVALRGATTVIPANGFAHVHKTAANTYFIDLGTVGGGGGGASNAEVWVGPGTPVDITPVTTTQLWVDTDDPGAVGGGGGGTVSDASTTAKGIVMLAGDLAGTADAPRVPALLTKSDATHTHTSGAGAAATTTTPGIITLAGDLAGTSAAPTVPGLALKADLTHTHGTSGSGVGEVAFDTFPGGDDEAKLAAAFSFAGAQTYPPTIAFTNRLNGPFGTIRPTYPGLRLKGPPGYNNAERGDNNNGCRLQLTMNGAWLTTSDRQHVRRLADAALLHRFRHQRLRDRHHRLRHLLLPADPRRLVVGAAQLRRNRGDQDPAHRRPVRRLLGDQQLLRHGFPHGHLGLHAVARRDADRLRRRLQHRRGRHRSAAPVVRPLREVDDRSAVHDDRGPVGRHPDRRCRLQRLDLQQPGRPADLLGPQGRGPQHRPGLRRGPGAPSAAGCPTSPGAGSPTRWSLRRPRATPRPTAR